MYESWNIEISKKISFFILIPKLMEHWWLTWICSDIMSVRISFFLWCVVCIVQESFWLQPFLFVFEISKSVNFLFTTNVRRSNVYARLLHWIFWKWLEILISRIESCIDFLFDFSFLALWNLWWATTLSCVLASLIGSTCKTQILFRRLIHSSWPLNK